MAIFFGLLVVQCHKVHQGQLVRFSSWGYLLISGILFNRGLSDRKDRFSVAERNAFVEVFP